MRVPIDTQQIKTIHTTTSIQERQRFWIAPTVFFAPLDRHIVAWLQLAPESRVLDAGCGSGGMTRLLAQAVGSGGEVVGLDANPQLIEWGRSQVKETDVVGQIQFKYYLEAWLSSYLHNPGHKQRLSTRDISTLEQLLDPASPHYVFARDDLHGIVVETMYVGSLSDENHL
jgi:SAM-dependent methyltransferase